MWLVVGQDGDVEARWIAKELRARTDRPVELIEASTLAHDCRWEHRIGGAGASSRLVVGHDTVVDSARVDGVVNRLTWLGADGFLGASHRDRDYATGELYALGLSWLESLGPCVLNRPTGIGLSGAWRTPGKWRALARSVGLPIVPYGSDDGWDSPGDVDDQVVIVLDGEVLDDGLPPEVGAGLIELQRVSGLDLLEARLTAGGALRTVSFLACLSRLGDRVADAVHTALVRRGR